jgi:hypothetical protein
VRRLSEYWEGRPLHEMDPSNRRSSSVTALLGGLVVLIGLAGLMAMVPMVKCPNCDGSGVFVPLVISGRDDGSSWPRCPYCVGNGKVRLLKKWMWGGEIVR